MWDPLTRTLLVLTFVTAILAGAVSGALLLKVSLAVAIAAAAAVVVAAAGGAASASAA
jgi:hypothetical protein